MTEKKPSVEDTDKYLKENSQKLIESLSRIKISLMTRTNLVFITSFFLDKPIEFTSELNKMGMPTAATDGKKIAIDPIFWDSLDKETKIWALCHETFHMMFLHCDRKINSDIDGQIWGIASDCVVNSMLAVSTIGTAPDCAIKSDYQGTVELKINNANIRIEHTHKKSVEEVYELIKKHVKDHPGPGQNQNGSGATGNFKVSQNGQGKGEFDMHQFREFSPEEREAVEDDVRKKLVDAKMCGNLPGWLGEAVEEMLESKINYMAEIGMMIEPLLRCKPTFCRPSRRGLSMGLNLPGKKRQGATITFAIDTSGSIGQNEIELFLGNIQSAFKQYPPGALEATVLFHDTEVYAEVDLKDITDVDVIRRTQLRQGGTSHRDVFEKATEAGTKVLVCLTDGYSEFPETKSIPKVLWIVTGGGNCADRIPTNLGRVIEVASEDL